MKAFFRNNGNAIIYIVLPIFFLFLTVAFIELTPSKSISIPFEPCNENGQCCNASGCDAEVAEECGPDGICFRTNVFCPGGETPDDTPNGCTCPDGTECIVCQPDEVFIASDNTCFRVCAQGEDPNANNCLVVEGSGEAFPCSLNKHSPVAGSPLSALSVMFGLFALLGIRALRRSE